MTELLSDVQTTEALQHLPQWHQDGPRLTRTAELAGFAQAIQVVNRIAEIAEQEKHHPDIDVRYRTLVFHCTTHWLGGITQADVSMAQEIESVLDAFESS